MNFVFSMFFLQFGLGGAGVQIVETCIFLRGTVMKASSHEKHSKQQWKKKKNKKQKVQTHGQGLGRGLAGDMGLNFLFFFCFFGFSMVFCSLAKTSRTQKNKKQKVQTHGQGLGYPHTNQKTKTKKPKNQETKKPKKPKKPKNQDCTPQGEGVRCRVLGLVFLFFLVILFFLFFCFLVFPWFFAVWPKPREHKKKQKKPKSSDPWARSGLSTHKPKKPKNQETKKPKNTKKQKNKKIKKTKIAHPKGRRSDAECWVLSFCFFCFLFFWFWFVCG